MSEEKTICWHCKNDGSFFPINNFCAKCGAPQGDVLDSAFPKGENGNGYAKLKLPNGKIIEVTFQGGKRVTQEEVAY